MAAPFVPFARHVAAALLAAGASLAPGAQPLVVQGLDCRGDDTAWRVDATRTAAQFSTTVPRKREVVFRGTLQSLPGTVVWRGDTTHLPRETMVIAAREETCRMALPGIPTGTHKALLSIRAGEAATGCCNVRAGYDARVAPIADLAAKPADDWTRSLVQLLPGLNACVTRNAPTFRAVTAARAQGTTVRVRLKQTDGKDVDCVVDATGRGTPTLTPAAAEPVASGPWWYPARDPAPIVACGRLERAQNPRGAALGYLQYDPC